MNEQIRYIIKRKAKQSKYHKHSFYELEYAYGNENVEQKKYI